VAVCVNDGGNNDTYLAIEPLLIMICFNSISGKKICIVVSFGIYPKINTYLAIEPPNLVFFCPFYS